MNEHFKPPAADRAAQIERYAGTGWELIPLQGNSKRPPHKNWTKRDYAEFEPQRHIASGGNVGVRINDAQLVIDVDPRNGGEVGFAKLCRDIGADFSDCPRVITGSGGSHYYLRKPPEIEVRGSLPEEYAGVEFKRTGQQVVAAGSVHPDTGNAYEWDEFSPRVGEAPDVPAALMEIIRRPDAASAAGTGGEHTAAEVGAMLSALDPTDFREQDKWQRLMMACHHASAGEAREEFLDWSAEDPGYADRRDENGRRWDSLHSDSDSARLTYRTLYKFLRDAGREDAIPVATAEDDFDDGASPDPDEAMRTALAVSRGSNARDDYKNAIFAINSAGLEPAFDELKQKTVMLGDVPWAEAFGRDLSEQNQKLLRLHLMRRHNADNYQPSKENIYEAATAIAYLNKFNPVVEYLDGLVWDGVERVKNLFPAYFRCGEGEYESAVSVCFMVGAVRRARRPGCKFDTMPVLKGAQGQQKSTGVRALFGDDWFSDAELGDLRDKDAVLGIQGAWVQEMAEIDSLRRSDLNVLKAFCSRQVDRFRAPYAKATEDLPRRCVFFGTVNEGGYLRDLTGGRRFWPLTSTGTIDVKTIRRDRDQLWAEAAFLEATGEPDVLPERLWPTAAERQAEETARDPWIDMLRDFLEARAARKFSQELGAVTFVPDDGLHAPSMRDQVDAAREDQAELALLPDDKVHTCELFEALGVEGKAQTGGQAQRLRVAMESGLGWKYKASVRIGDRVRAGYERPASA